MRRSCYPALATSLLAGLVVSTTQAAPADRGREIPGGEWLTRHFADADGLQLHYRRAGTYGSARRGALRR